MPRLAIDIEAQLASFEAGIRKVDGTVSGLAGRLNGAFGGVSTALQGIATAVAGGSIAALVRNFADAGDQLNKLSQKTGVAVESLSELQYAARLSDVSTEQLGDGFRKLAVNMTEAARGTGEAKDAFKALGISQRELQSLSPDAAFRRIADAFANIEDGAGKSALAVKIFGRSGTEMIPLLNSGADGLARMGVEARRLGLVISAETAQAAEQFNDNMTRLGASLAGLRNQALLPILATLGEFVQKLTDATAASGTLGEGLARSLIGQGKDTARELADVEERIRGIRIEREKLRGSLGDSAIARAIPFMSRVSDLEQEEGRLRVTRDYLKRLQEIRTERTKQADAPTQRRAAPTIVDSAEQDKLRRQLEKGTEKGGIFFADIILDQIKKLGEARKELNDALIGKLQGGPELAQQQAEKLRDTVDSLLAATPSGQRANINRQIDELNARLVAGKVNAQEYEDVFTGLSKELTSIRDVGADVFDDLNFATDEWTQRLELAIKGWGNEFNETVVQMVRTGQFQFGKLVDSILTDILRLTVYQTITRPIFTALSGAIVGGGPTGQGSPFVPAYGNQRAFGGPVSAGMPYLVGERGPEWVVPRNDATVVPNGAWGGVQFSQQIVINAPTDAAVIRAAVAQGAVVARSEIARAARVGAMS